METNIEGSGRTIYGAETNVTFVSSVDSACEFLCGARRAFSLLAGVLLAGLLVLLFTSLFARLGGVGAAGRSARRADRCLGSRTASVFDGDWTSRLIDGDI